MKTCYLFVTFFYENLSYCLRRTIVSIDIDLKGSIQGNQILYSGKDEAGNFMDEPGVIRLCAIKDLN